MRQALPATTLASARRNPFWLSCSLEKSQVKATASEPLSRKSKKEIHDQIDAKRKEMLEIQLLGGQEAAAAAAAIDDTVNAVGVKACVYEFSTP